MSVKICVVSGGRADFGLLLEPMRRLRDDPAFDLSIVLTGQHLRPGASDGRAVVAAEEFRSVSLVDMHLAGDDAVAVSASAGHALSGLAKVFRELQPDLILLLGDRYEILCAALAATLARIPIAHIAGGDVTSGAIDDAFRHAITAMAHIHLVTNAASACRVRQLGQESSSIHNIGNPGLDLLLTTPIISRDEFFKKIDFMPRPRNLLVTFHPTTRAKDSLSQTGELVGALTACDDDFGVVVTGSNADPEGESVTRIMRQYAETTESACFIPHLGSTLYANALRHLDAIVGNSSSGLYEAPSFGIPTVNIGTRQNGRLKASSVICCEPNKAAIVQAIETALRRGRQPSENLYGDGHATDRLMSVLKTVVDPKALFAKSFHDLDG